MLERYETYKDSGIEWIGEIPEEWDVLKLGNCLALNQGGVWGDDPISDAGTVVLRSTEQTIDGHWKLDNPAIRNLQNESNVESKMLVAGDLLVTKSSGSELHIGKTTIVDDYIESLNCSYSNFMQRLRVNSRLSPRLCWYLLNSDLARAQYCYLQNSTSGIGNLNADTIADIYIPVPPKSLQDCITDFLGAKTAEIDKLVTDCEREVELLQEYRKAVISEAVTKGLYPAAPMKNSGIEWISEIPSAWKPYRMSALFREVVETGYPDLPILTVSINTGISDEELNNDQLERRVNRSDDRRVYKRVLKGDIAYNMMRAWQGSIGASRVDGIVSPAYTVLRLRSSDIALASFVEYLLRTQSAIEELRRRSYGIADFRLRLYWQYFKDMVVYLPPIEEQREIVDYLNTRVHELDVLSDELSSMAGLLRDYRKSLICEVITGRFRVPAV